MTWYLTEPGGEHAVAIQQAGSNLVAPDLLVSEPGNVLWKKDRRGELDAAEAREIGDAFVQACPGSLRASLPYSPTPRSPRTPPFDSTAACTTHSF